MFEGKRVLGLIPAKGERKGVAGKNIRNLHGKPLIAWTIEAAMESACFDTIMVSTENSEIAGVATECGAHVPFLRHIKLTSDSTPVMDVIMNTLDWYGARSQTFDIVVLLPPTSPLRNGDDIKRALGVYFERQAKAVVSVCRAKHHPFRMNILPPDGSLRDFLSQEAFSTPRQQLPVFYRLNGALYIADVITLRNTNNFYGPDTYAFIMEAEHSLDIDELIDFQRAELLMQKRIGRG